MSGATTTWRTVDEFIRSRLGELGPGQRGLVFVLDPETALSWREDGDASLRDATDREWRVFSYRGNDMALRARLAAVSPTQSTVIWVRPAPLQDATSIDLTTLADIVARADGFLDASLSGVLAAVLPGVALPSEISTWAPSARVDPRGFARALRGVLAFRGKPVSRRHVLAAAVCQSSVHATPELAWLDESSLPNLIASYLHLLCADRSDQFRIAAGEAFRHVASLLGGQAGGARPIDVAEAITKVPAPLLIDFCYTLAAARRHRLADPVAALINQGFVGPEITALLAQESPELLVGAAERLNEQPEALRALALEAERGVNSDRVRQIQALFRRAASEWASEPVAAVRLGLLASLVVEDDAILSADAFDSEPEPPVGSAKYVRAATGLLRVVRSLARYSGEAANAKDCSTLDLQGLVDAYVGGLATSEFDLSTALRDLRSVAAALGEQKKIEARLNDLQQACEHALRVCDARLAELLRSDSSLVASSARAIYRWLPTHVAPQLQASPKPRLWLLVFDGLRWDLWERVLRPLLEEEGWQVGVEAALSILPTETAFCRRALLAGSPPDLWPTPGASEETLARRFFQKLLGPAARFAYRLKAEEGSDDGASMTSAGDVNVWIYRTPDRQTHLAGGSLRDVATQFEAYLRENVLPELRGEIGSDDLVFVATDHGFTRVSSEHVHTVSLPQDRVQERFLTLGNDEDAASDTPGLRVKYAALGHYHVAIGDWVFACIGGAVPTTFRHGGATLREMVVPLVQLRRPTRVGGSVEIELSGPAQIDEDAEVGFTARLRNQSTEKVTGQLIFETNKGIVTKMPIVLSPGTEAERTCKLVGSEDLEWLSARLASGSTTLVARTITLTVQLKPGIKLSGLEKLDDW